MDNNLLNILLGVIGNVMTSLLACMTTKTGQALIGENFLEQWELEKTALLTIIQKAIGETAEDIQLTPPPSIEELCLFIASPEVEELIRHVYCAVITEKRGMRYLGSVQKEFSALFSSRLGVDESQAEIKATYLFRVLQISIERASNHAIDKGILSGHEAKSNLRHKIVMDQLQAIEKNLSFLAEPPRVTSDDAIAFEEKYRNQILNRYMSITPPSFDSIRRIPIDSIYVFPSLTREFTRLTKEGLVKGKDLFPVLKGRSKGSGISTLASARFMRSLYRAVILGNPGGGKTTLIQKLCYDLIKHYNQRLFANRLVSPMPIVLRDYGNERKLRGYSIVDYIESYANTHLQIKAHPGAIEYLLRNGRVVVMFDGLDELIDTSYRRVITEDIESFCHAYPSVPILVTSREVGYEQAPLSAEFTVFRLSPFNEEQVSEYVTKWFSTDSTLSRHQQKQQTDSFLAQSLIVPDIRDNPLMLALMCNLYKGENYIPRNRPDVYEKCASMLFERWDKQRGIVVPLPFEHSIRSATRFLAYWIYSSQDLQAGVTEAKLVRECTEYLCGRRFDDRDEAESAARQFVEFCHGRAWVFTDVGTTANGEKIYQFTHRTFLEYFAAAHLVSTNYTPKQLLAVMRPRIAVREWDNLAQLAFQIQSRSLDGAADELLLGIVTSPSEDRGRRYNELHFVARCLAFLVPTPKVTREVVGCAMRAFLDNRGSQSTEAIFRSLLDSAEENQIAVLSAIETIFVDHISHITAIGDLILTLRSVFCLPGGNQQGTEQERKLPKSMNQGRNKLSNPIGRILDASKENLIKHGKFNRQVANELLWRSILSMSDYLNWHADLYQMFFPDGNGLSSVSSRPIVDGLLQGLNTGQGAGFASWLIEFGLFLMPKPLPWFIVPWSSRREALRERAKSCFFSVRDSLQLRKSHKQLSPIDSDIVWGAFCLSALLLELSAVPMSRRCWLAEFLLVFCPDVQWQEDKSLSTDGFNAQGLRLGEQKIQLILNWSRGEIDLTDFCAS